MRQTEPLCRAAVLAQKALQDWPGAELLLREAFTIFRAVGYDWRAALAAKALADLTHEASWLTVARNLVREYPQSWIAAQLAPNHARDSDLRSLKPAQQRVFFAACEGLSSREIGHRFKRSRHTVDTHLRAIFKVIGVHSRGELQAEARRRGIVPSFRVGELASAHADEFFDPGAGAVERCDDGAISRPTLALIEDLVS